MYFQVYIDTLFIVNLIMNYLLLLLVSKLVRCPATHLSVFTGAVFGAFSFCILILMPWLPGYVKIMIAYGGVSMVMIRIGLKIKEFRLLWIASIYLFVCVFLFSGSLQWLTQQIPYLRQMRMNSLMIIMGGYGCYLICSTLLKKYKEKEKQLFYQLEFTIAGETISIHGILDTGNGLVDPLTKKPVSLIEKSVLNKYIEQGYQKGFCVIPFHSIGKENGILYGYEIEDVKIQTSDAIIKKQKIIVAVVAEKISNSGSYQMILHPELFNS